jgi:hypothetical protein
VWLRRLAIVLLAIPGIGTATDLASSVRAAASFTPPAASLADRIPPAATVDIVMLGPGARESAVFLGAELAPRDVRFFDGWEAWRARRRAVFMNDPRAANAAPGPPPGPATVVLEIGESIRIMPPP